MNEQKSYGLIKTCLVCQVSFCKKPCNSYRYWEAAKYCSQLCFSKAIRGKPSLNRGRKRPDISGSKNYFYGKRPIGRLSQPGHRKPYLTMPRGSTHHAWKGGVTSVNQAIRISQAYLNWRNHVFRRDDYTCQACGKKGGKLQVDHELPFAFFPELRLEILNGRVLCLSCHKATPTYQNNHNVYA